MSTVKAILKNVKLVRAEERQRNQVQLQWNIYSEHHYFQNIPINTSEQLLIPDFPINNKIKRQKQVWQVNLASFRRTEDDS